MKRSLLHYVIYSIGAVLVLTVGLSIVFSDGKKINLTEVRMSTTQSSKLYFKNIRSFFYDKEHRKDAQFDLYRIDTREKVSHKNKLNFVLVDNWLQGECYIIAESGIVDTNIDTLSIQWILEEDTGLLQLGNKDSFNNYIFAAQLFELLEQKAALTLLTSSDSLSFLEAEKKLLKKTLSDYFKLVGKLR